MEKKLKKKIKFTKLFLKIKLLEKKQKVVPQIPSPKKLSPVYEYPQPYTRFWEWDFDASFFFENKFLNFKKIVLPQLKTKTVKKKWTFQDHNRPIKKYYSKYNFIKKTYISNFWQKFLHTCKKQTELNFRKMYAIFQKWYRKKNNLLFGVDLDGKNYYEFFKYSPKPWIRQNYLNLPVKIAKKYLWLQPLICKRKVYRINRNRTFKRYKIPFNQTKYFFFRKWLRLWNQKRGLVKKVEMVGDRIFKKYIFLPFYNSSKKSFRNKINKLRAIYKPSEGNAMRGYFNHRLRFLSQDLNFVPLTNWVPHLVNFRDVITVSNRALNSVCADDQVARHSQIQLPEKKQDVCFSSNKYVNFASQINKKLSLNTRVEKDLSNPLENALVLNKKEVPLAKQFDQNYKAKLHEIVHMTSSYQKHKNFFFLSEFSKKKVPTNFKLNYDKTLAYMSNILKRCDISASHRINETMWTTAILQIKQK